MTSLTNKGGNEKTSSSFIGNINPIRYRGYYYDTETGFYYLQTRYYDPTICRFINADNYELVSQLSVGELNMYAYCGNNPVMRTDETGCFWDTFFDIVFLAWDIHDLVTDDGYKDWENWAALGADLLFTAIPFMTGGGKVVKLANVADNVSDFSKVTVIGETMSRVQTVSQFVNGADNLYDGFKAYDKLSNLGKGGKILAEIGGKGSNIIWLHEKLKKGYTIIDIGIDISRTSRSSSYIAERVFIGIWQSRNVWKSLYHLG